MTSKNTYEPTEAEIIEAARMIHEAKAHAGIIVVSATGSESSSQPIRGITGVFSDDRLIEGGPSWDTVLGACFEWDYPVRGVTLRDDDYEMISEVKKA